VTLQVRPFCSFFYFSVLSLGPTKLFPSLSSFHLTNHIFRFFIIILGFLSATRDPTNGWTYWGTRDWIGVVRRRGFRPTMMNFHAHAFSPILHLGR
jgi:hypothetical protein